MISLKTAIIVAFQIAAPPNADPSLAPWFSSLRLPGTDNNKGQKRCDIADCRNHPVQADGEYYRVFYDGRWLIVPSEAVSDRIDNPTGDYVTCIQRDHWTDGIHDGPIIRCLIRPPRM
jgi:hypothetical protein